MVPFYRKVEIDREDMKIHFKKKKKAIIKHVWADESWLPVPHTVTIVDPPTLVTATRGIAFQFDQWVIFSVHFLSKYWRYPYGIWPLASLWQDN